ncbi:MAG: bifunctional folylpolyglutamate synthase/dihydrofolate synthase [Clostridia bacterium]|nr:bifunctional folylpolyglutamate synthase/dihydrofolate synthase [Clostridia bacterium]
MTTQQALHYIHGLHSRGIRPGLERMHTALATVGHPERRLRVIHIAGTNGKGSTAEMLRCVLTAGGYRVGAYTSPTVTTLQDTITINGQPISDCELAVLTDRLIATGTELTEFEFVTVLALLWFAEQQVDFAVVECGLGGREDATNVFPAPLCAVFTPISLDHTKLLGDSVAAIATQKAGIIKPSCAVICSPEQPPEALAAIQVEATKYGLTVRRPADMCKVPLLAMHGEHQQQNARTVCEIAAVLRERGYALPEQAVTTGLATAALPCRQELVTGTPPILLDGAHNPDGIAALVSTVREQWPDTSVILLTGMLADKNVAACAELLAPIAVKVICCTPDHPDRAMSATELATHYPGAIACADVSTALEQAKRLAINKNLPLVVAGSFYLAAEVRRLLRI